VYNQGYLCRFRWAF